MRARVLDMLLLGSRSARREEGLQSQEARTTFASPASGLHRFRLCGELVEPFGRCGSGPVGRAVFPPGGRDLGSGRSGYVVEPFQLGDGPELVARHWGMAFVQSEFTPGTGGVHETDCHSQCSDGWRPSLAAGHSRRSDCQGAQPYSRHRPLDRRVARFRCQKLLKPGPRSGAEARSREGWRRRAVSLGFASRPCPRALSDIACVGGATTPIQAHRADGSQPQGDRREPWVCRWHEYPALEGRRENTTRGESSPQKTLEIPPQPNPQ